MAKLKIKRFKHWYQVVRDGYTVAQFLHRTQAEEFIRDNREGCPSIDLGWEAVSRRRDYGTIRRINLYP